MPSLAYQAHLTLLRVQVSAPVDERDGSAAQHGADGKGGAGLDNRRDGQHLVEQHALVVGQVLGGVRAVLAVITILAFCGWALLAVWPISAVTTGCVQEPGFPAFP